jgi:hypothetical protein
LRAPTANATGALFAEIAAMNRTTAPRRPTPLMPGTPTARRAFRCRCGRPVFFRNDTCLACGTPLGYDPELVLLRPLAPTRDPAVWRALRVRGTSAPLVAYRRCANAGTASGCNWLLRDDGDDRTQTLCRSCRLDRTLPDPAEDDNARLWLRVENAKRALVSQLIALRLPLASRVSEDPANGVAFDLLRAAPGGPPVVTGHADGIVTIDLAEGDDAHRERMRDAMGEPYRTLLGHLRHEIGHYYWQRLIPGTGREAPFRELFGDERVDYAAALRRHYDAGAPADWQDRHVSAYASAHPWEDWAETWAHYLHMLDALDTARSFGLVAHHDEIRYEPFTARALGKDAPGPEDLAFLELVNAWIELTGALNEVTRSMGEPDFYPFVLSAPAVRKLHFVHEVVRLAAGGCGLGGSPTGAGGRGERDGSSTGTGGGAIGGAYGGVGGSVAGQPGSGTTGTSPPADTGTGQPDAVIA